MIIKSKNTIILKSSIVFNEGKTAIIYQANTDLYVDGNPYEDLVTTKTLFNLTCTVSEIANIDLVTQTQINTWISENYPNT